MIDIQVLKGFGIFNGLVDNELVRIAELCHERTLNKGALSFNQGSKSTELHFCRTGGVDIIVQIFEPQGMRVTVHHAMAGEVYGWSSVIEPNIYTASAKCTEKTEEIYIKASDLLKLFEENSHIGYIVTRNLGAVISSRLTESQKKLAIEISTATHKEW
jgi:CRP-like cAMP-binding protein